MQIIEYQGTVGVQLLVDYFNGLDLSVDDILCEMPEGNYPLEINWGLFVKPTLESNVKSAFRVTHLPTKTMVYCDHSDDLIENLHRALGAMREALHKLRYGVLRPNRSDKRKAEKLDRLKRKKGL